MNKDKLFLILLIVILIAANYRFVNNLLVQNFDSRELVFVNRVVDGDTVIINGSSVRLLGINTPERGEKFYSEAKAYTENLVLNKTIIIKRSGKDKYNRDLAYLFEINSENINKKIISEGYANYYFPSGKDEFYDDFVSAWNDCITSGKNLCEPSEDVCANCIKLKEWDTKGEKVVLENICDFDCSLKDWAIKDEGRKKFVFENFILKKFSETEITNEDFGYDYVWTDSGDTIFLRDSENKLIFWKGY